MEEHASLQNIKYVVFFYTGYWIWEFSIWKLGNKHANQWRNNATEKTVHLLH